MKGYKVLRNGQIIGKFGRPLTQYKRGEYLAVMMSINKKHKIESVHRLLAKKYIPNPLNKPMVNHIDKNKTNNKLSNLEWVTCSENMQHSSKLSWYDIILIRQVNHISASVLGLIYGISARYISKIKNYETWQ